MSLLRGNNENNMCSEKGKACMEGTGPVQLLRPTQLSPIAICQTAAIALYPLHKDIKIKGHTLLGAPKGLAHHNFRE